MQPETVCYWRVGRDTDDPQLVADQHDKTGELLGETACLGACHNLRQARKLARAYAKLVGAPSISFDSASDEFFRRD